MNEADLLTAYQDGLLLTTLQIEDLQQLWEKYQTNQIEAMREIADRYITTLPFLLPAVQAHQKRQPDKDGWGHPERLVQSIQNTLQTKDFPTIFREFSKRAPIYGFGDLQVKRIWEQVNGI